MGETKVESFGTAPDGSPVKLYTMRNSSRMSVTVMDYGAILVGCLVPDAKGNIDDVVLGYDKLGPYVENSCFFGATIGPNANRIAGAEFALGGKKYKLAANEGPNNLHSHRELGFHKRVWKTEMGTNSVTFSLESPDGDMGFPGNKKVQVTYSLMEDNTLNIHYQAVTDAETIFNLTNHSYFNLAGQGKGTICDHTLELKASNYTPVGEGSIPTGEIAPVKGTPMDFTAPRRIGDRIDEEDTQLEITGGYDHNWVIDGAAGTYREAAVVTEPGTGRIMKVYTDLPGIQFYAGNGITRQGGKSGAIYDKRSGLCLETQYFPNTANEPGFPQAVFSPRKNYDTVTAYQFIW